MTRVCASAMCRLSRGEMIHKFIHLRIFVSSFSVLALIIISVAKPNMITVNIVPWRQGILSSDWPARCLITSYGGTSVKWSGWKKL